jgi:hypothetical protein
MRHIVRYAVFIGGKMRIALMMTLVAGTTAGVGCRVEGTGINTTAVQATLSDYEAISLVMLGGATWGEATLHVTDNAGVVREMAVSFAGPSGGLLMDVHVAQEDLLFEGSDEGLLQIPEGGVPMDDIFGTYDGGGGGIGLGLGYCGLELDNNAAVRLVINGVCGGMSMARTENWLTLSVDGEVTEIATQ